MTVNVTLQYDFSNTLTGQTKRGTQLDKRSGTNRDTENKYLH